MILIFCFNHLFEVLKKFSWCSWGYAGINLTGYHPPGTQGLLHQNVCPASGLLHNRKCPGAGPINDDVPGVGYLHQHKEC